MSLSPNQLRDKLGNASLVETSRMAMSVVNAIQTNPNDKGSQLGGLLTAFLMVFDTCGLPLEDLLGMARNIVNDAEGTRPEFMAVKDYIENEVL